jgi:dephospho-CoA kinase
MNKIIAIVGMCGSGKSVASNYFKENGYNCIYFGGVTMDKLKEEGLEDTPENERMEREKLRNLYGMGAFAQILLPKIEKNYKIGNVVLDGLYSWEELKILKEKFPNMIVVAIICDKNIRYFRISNRSVRPLNEIEATKRDVSEIENLHKAGPIAYADYYIFNNGDITSYIKELENIKNLEVK